MAFTAAAAKRPLFRALSHVSRPPPRHGLRWPRIRQGRRRPCLPWPDPSRPPLVPPPPRSAAASLLITRAGLLLPRRRLSSGALDMERGPKPGRGRASPAAPGLRCAWPPPREDEAGCGAAPGRRMVMKKRVVCAMFGIFTATASAYFGTPEENTKNPRVTAEDFMAMPRWFPASTSSSLAFRPHEAAWLAAATQPNASGVGDGERFLRTMPHCRLFAIRSCPELEPQMFPLLAELYSIPVVPASLLLPDDRHDDGDHDSSAKAAARSGALQWLDEQPSRSVIYVALGSEAPVTAEGVQELALGLELSGARFLWALGLPSGATDAATGAASLLPNGFEARTRGRGAVCTGWVPQMQVLAHAAVGAFLTHCGWGSVIENLKFGHPLVMLPFIVDQGLIARMMAERGIGVEVDRRDDGWFGREDVAAAVRRVMVEEEGKALALNARSLHEVVVGDDGGRQERYVDELVDCLQTELVKKL